MDLQGKQKDGLLRMLSLNSSATDSVGQWGEQWKVLVYDRYCRDIISPILKLNELRKQGVTLHMLIESQREEIPDVPAVYFVQPTEDTMRRIAADISRSLYVSLYLNFASPVPRNMLETLAKLTVETGNVGSISKVYDQYLNFVSLQPNLFTLNQPNSYVSYNDPTIVDTQIETTMNQIVQGLFSVLATLGVIPIIRCPNNEGPSTMVAQKLHDLLREHVVGRSEVFSDAVSNAGYQRPVLIIMDRNEDLASALHHPSTYQALVDDLLGIYNNRVKVKLSKTDQDGTSKQMGEKTYDLDVTTDAFFEKHATSLFPDAIAANEEDMKEVTKREEELRARAGAGALDGGAQGLVAAVDTLPALIEKKKMLEIHTNIFQAAFEVVASRHVPTYSMLEQKLIDGGLVDKNEIIQLLSDSEKGSIQDKLRLMIIYFLATGVSSSEMTEMENAIQSVAEAHGTSADMRAWHYIRTNPSFQRHASLGDALRESKTPTASPPTSNPSMGMLKGLAGNLAGQAQGWIQQAAASVKNFLPENKKLHITRVTDAICEHKPNTEDETFLYLDPKVKTQTARHRSPFREAIVFMIGGGNYNEVQNLQTYAQGQTDRTVIYGCTELLSSEKFLDQLHSLKT